MADPAATSEIVSLINSIGFPIAMVILMFIREGKTNAQWRDTLKEISTTVTKNTEVITELSGLIKGMFNSGKS